MLFRIPPSNRGIIARFYNWTVLCYRRIVYGNNEILVPVQSIGVLLLLEVLNPFYIFQVFTLCVWFAEKYFYYTAAIICMSLFGIVSSIIQTRKVKRLLPYCYYTFMLHAKRGIWFQNQINLHETVASTETVLVHRSSKVSENIPSSELVPGDIIELPKHQATVICDAVLLTGQCILNESMLTGTSRKLSPWLYMLLIVQIAGESVPVTKTPLPSRHVLYDSKECSHHTIFSGTTIIQTRCDHRAHPNIRNIRWMNELILIWFLY